MLDRKVDLRCILQQFVPHLPFRKGSQGIEQGNNPSGVSNIHQHHKYTGNDPKLPPEIRPHRMYQPKKDQKQSSTDKQGQQVGDQLIGEKSSESSFVETIFLFNHKRTVVIKGKTQDI